MLPIVQHSILIVLQQPTLNECYLSRLILMHFLTLNIIKDKRIFLNFFIKESFYTLFNLHEIHFYISQWENLC